MKVALVAPLWESVPPVTYGGTERVVHYLTEALIDLGHEVTLFAAGDSKTRAELRSPCERALRLDPNAADPLALHILLMEMVAQAANEFDVIHWNIDFLHFPVSRRLGLPSITTLHGRLDMPHLPILYSVFRDMPVVSISDAQRRHLPMANWIGTVHHGLPEKLLAFRERRGDHLAFLGRISPEKRPDLAIEIAKRAGIPLKIAAKVDRVDQRYFEERIRPMLNHPLIEFVGEINEAQKAEFLGSALALLFPIDWPEPFGLVMIEAMACGTPVIARPCGSVPEVLTEGVTGFICETVDECVRAVQRIDQISRRACRREFERRFTARRMAHDYVSLYERVIKQGLGSTACVA